MQPRQPCDDAASVCGYSGGSVLRDIPARGSLTEFYRGCARGGYRACDRNRADDRYITCDADDDGRKELETMGNGQESGKRVPAFAVLPMKHFPADFAANAKLGVKSNRGSKNRKI